MAQLERRKKSTNTAQHRPVFSDCGDISNLTHFEVTVP